MHNLYRTVVTAIRIGGNRLIPEADILSVVRTKIGDTFDRDKIVEDLKAIGSMGYFDESSLRAIPELNSDGGIVLSIHVRENLPVNDVQFKGNKVFANEQLVTLFLHQLGEPQNQRQLHGAIDALEIRI